MAKLPIAAQQKPKKEIGKWKDIPHKDQITILVLARLVEPLVQTSLLAYMFHQLKSFDEKLPDSTISWQAGVLQASFSGAQTITGWMWGRAADSYGRKTVLILGSVGTLISCIGFGLSHSFVSALLFRFLGGLVNGNIPVMRTMVSEIVKEKKYQARAFLLMPMCFNIGVIIGPALGGLLADPAGTYPRLFGGVWWMTKWPYLAPNIASAVIVALNLVLISAFLKETLPSADNLLVRVSHKMRTIISKLGGSGRSTQEYHAVPDSEQAIPLMSVADEDDPKSTEGKKSTGDKQPPQKLPFRRIWTRNVMFTLLAHFATAFHIGTFNNLWFIFLSAQRYDPDSSGQYHPRGPFVFTGGLNLPSVQVGTAMSTLGIIGIVLQILIYPRCNDKYGVLPLYRLFVYGFPIAYLITPYLAIVPSRYPPPQPAGGVLVWLALCIVLFFFVVSRTFVLPATMILINNCAPHPSVLGTVHGVAQSVGSAARTLGPGVAGYLFGVGLNIGVVGLAWWVLGVAGCLAVVTSLWVREGTGHEITLDGEERRPDSQTAGPN